MNPYRLCCFLLLFLLLGCRPAPAPIDFGEDEGAYCRMIITDPRYGAELVTAKGKVYKFDAVECMVNYLREAPEGVEYAYQLAVAADTPGELHPVDDLTFLRSAAMPSPMGADLTAFRTREAAKAALEAHGGELLRWQEVVAYVPQMHAR